ncbi:bacteriorhodopsin-like, partial [Chlamydiia bacterium]|nr:bacteriorhodopsin-like [Chlamydiia bacterium]
MKPVFKFLLLACCLFISPTVIFGATVENTVNSTLNQLVGFSFWVIFSAMVAATLFFYSERSRVSNEWKTSLTVMSMVTLIAAMHYYYMRGEWDSHQASPTALRYIDWTLTVPLQMIEFYLILRAVSNVSSGVFFRLLGGTVVMLLAGYLGEAKLFPFLEGTTAYLTAFVIGMAGWIYILYEIFAGEAARKSEQATEGVQMAFNACRVIVLVGWAIYPIGYLMGYYEALGNAPINLIYNLADFINKIAFGVFIWSAAVH